jgi:hypothetical protein
VTLSAALCATVIDPMPSAGASGMVVREVLAYAAGEASGISARAVSLAETTLACLTISPVKAIVAVVLTASVLGGGVGLLTARQEPKGDERPVATNTSAVATPNSVKIDRLIQQLGSNRFAEREQATRTLEKIGEPALEALRKAAQSAEDHDIKQRSGELVRNLEKDLFREVRQFVGHALGVRVVAASPDGRRALSSSFDTTVRLWDLRTGNTIRVFQGHAGSVEGVAFSPDGKRAVSGSVDGSVIVWDLETGQEIDHMAEHKGQVWGVDFAPDGKSVLSAGFDRSVRQWDVQTAQEVRSFLGHTDSVGWAAYARDGRRAISGAGDKTLRLWDLASGQELKRFAGHNGPVFSGAISRDGRFILSGSGDGRVRLWDVETGKLSREWMGHRGVVTGVAFSPNGRYAVSCSGDLFKDGQWSPAPGFDIRLWNIKSGREMGRYLGHSAEIKSVLFTPDGRHLLSGSGWHDAAMVRSPVGLGRWAVSVSLSPRRNGQAYEAHRSKTGESTA